ncbi:terminase [Streptomyces morookaense]|uniref:terminase n=1 Tax=Streptomyces morookaense TaxID=1970 RepID=UPI0033EA387C
MPAPVFAPVRTVEDTVPELTLARDILRWTAHRFRADWRYTPEQVRILARWYAVDADGGFVYTSGTLRRLKGWGKDPMMASVCWVELIGPCRFGGWHPDGSPKGVPAKEPWVQIFATSATQNTNTMSALLGLLTDETVALYAVDLGQEKCYATLPDGRRCRLEAKASSYRAAEGGRPSFALMNETWHWVTGNHGPKLAATIRANAAKVSGRYMEITNAPVVGEDSVAENTLYDFQKQRDGKNRATGLYYDSVEAPSGVDLGDEEQLRAALLCARGDAVWVNPDRVMPEIWSASTTEDESRRKYLNQTTVAEDALVDPEDWGRCEVEGRDLRPGDRIALGLDGGEADDSTALVAMRVRDALCVPLGVWEKPDGPAGANWQVDKDVVSDAVANAFATYNVTAFFSDVAYWETYTAQWSETYGPKLLIRSNGRSAVGYDMRANQREITTENMAMVGAIEAHQLLHQGHFTLRRHVENARKRPNQYGISFRKESRESRHKVDAYAALLLCWIARRRLIESGKLKPQRAVAKLTAYEGY